MPQSNFENYLDRIYEAAVVPDKWPNLLEDIARDLGGLGGTLFTASKQKTQAVWSPGVVGLRDDFVGAGWPDKNSRVLRVFERDLVGMTVTDHDLFTPDELDRDPMYDYMRAVGVGWCVGFLTEVPSGDAFVFSIERQHANGPFEAEHKAFIDSLRPHVSRSALLTARLGWERLRAAAEAMGFIGLPTGVISHRRKLIAANDLLAEMIPSIVIDGHERMRLCDSKADRLFVSTLAKLSASEHLNHTLSFPVAGGPERPAMVIHIVPVRRAANDIFSGALCMMIVTPLGRKGAPPASVIQGLFDLTAAEAKIVRGLAKGETLQEMAQRSGTAVETVRTHLKHVFAKTGLSKQSELIALLASVTL